MSSSKSSVCAGTTQRSFSLIPYQDLRTVRVHLPAGPSDVRASGLLRAVCVDTAKKWTQRRHIEVQEVHHEETRTPLTIVG